MRHLPAAAAVLVAATLVPAGLAAQCRPPSGSHEARLLAFYSVPIAFAPDVAAVSGPAGSVRLALEGALVPTASASLQHTEFCYTGRAEHTGLTPLFGRPRLSAVLPGGVGVEVSYLPPVTVASATPDLASAAAWITRPAAAGILLTVRAHATRGTVRGPITCPAPALQQGDPSAPCYGTRPSSDTFRPDMFGADIVATRRVGVRARLGAGLGLVALRPRFRVGFADLLGGTDRTSIAVNLRRATAMLSASLAVTPRCDVAGQAYAFVGDAVTARVFAGCRIAR